MRALLCDYVGADRADQVAHKTYVAWQWWWKMFENAGFHFCISSWAPASVLSYILRDWRRGSKTIEIPIWLNNIWLTVDTACGDLTKIDHKVCTISQPRWQMNCRKKSILVKTLIWCLPRVCQAFSGKSRGSIQYFRWTSMVWSHRRKAHTTEPPELAPRNLDVDHWIELLETTPDAADYLLDILTVEPDEETGSETGGVGVKHVWCSRCYWPSKANTNAGCGK